MQTEGAVEMVRRGYDEDTRCLGFTVSFYSDPEGVRKAIRVIDQYNDFEAEKVIKALDALKPFTAEYGWTKVGRESSPVLYIDLTTDADESAVELILRGADADEVSFDNRAVRAWWD